MLTVRVACASLLASALPVLRYLAVTAPLLLAVLLVWSAYLDPSGGPVLSTRLDMRAGHANAEPGDAFVPRDGSSESTRLKARPLGR